MSTEMTDTATLQRLLDQLATTVVGKGEQLRVVLAAVLAGGHVQLEDVPGVGKTLAAKALAEHLGLAFSRIQFTPDMLPSDVTGALHYDQRSCEYSFRRGPLFAGLVLADEVNRAPAKTQAALLQAMAEGEVSVDGTTHPLPSPFHVIATANPVEYEGTFSLPEAQLDRFHVRARIGYPDAASEITMVHAVARTGTASAPANAADLIINLPMWQARLRSVQVSDPVADYVVRLVTGTRTHSALSLGASPRGSLALTQCAQAWALIDRRDFTTPDDVQLMAEPVLAHRLSLRPELWGSRMTTEQVLEQVLAATPTPNATAG